MGRVLTFTGKTKATAPRQPVLGSVTIWPSEEMGGSWSVWHESEGGGSAGHVGTWFSYDDAVKAARKAAAEYGARLDVGGGAA